MTTYTGSCNKSLISLCSNFLMSSPTLYIRFYANDEISGTSSLQLIIDLPSVGFNKGAQYFNKGRSDHPVTRRSITGPCILASRLAI